MIDLHTHTTCSDGILSVKKIVESAIDNDVQVLAITDHDTIIGLSEYQNKYLTNDIVVVPGVEFSTETNFLGKKTKIHLLGYGYTVGDQAINDVLTELYQRRYDDNKEYIYSLIKKYSYLSEELFIGFDFGKYGWIHKLILGYIGSKLTEEQRVQLREFLLTNPPIYNRYNENIESILPIIHDCGGYSVFAHPPKCNLTPDELNKLVGFLHSIGLDGIETYHIDSNLLDRKLVHEIALRYGLYETGGSDFHNYEDGYIVGDSKIDYPSQYEPLLVKRLIREKKVIGDVNGK